MTLELILGILGAIGIFALLRFGMKKPWAVSIIAGLAVLFAVGYFLGTVENKSEFMKNAANKLIPDKEAKVIDFKTELAREQEQVQTAVGEAVQQDVKAEDKE